LLWLKCFKKLWLSAQNLTGVGLPLPINSSFSFKVNLENGVDNVLFINEKHHFASSKMLFYQHFIFP